VAGQPLALQVAHVVGAVMLGGFVPVAGIVAGANGPYELGIWAARL
jgi:hypothetical protein